MERYIITLPPNNSNFRQGLAIGVAKFLLPTASRSLPATNGVRGSSTIVVSVRTTVGDKFAASGGAARSILPVSGW